MIFDWDEYSVDLCSDINQLNEYLPLYAFINAHSTMDVSSQDLRMTLWFFEYALGLSEEIATRIGQYTREYRRISLRRLPARCSTMSVRKIYLLYAGPYGRQRLSEKPGGLPVL